MASNEDLNMLKAKKARTSLYFLFLILWWLWLMHRSSNSTYEYCIKVPVNLKLQPRRHTDTVLILTSINLMYLMIHFLCRKLKKILLSDNLLSNNYKQIRWQYSGSTFLELKVPVFKTVVTTNKFVDSNYTANTFFRTPSTTNKNLTMAHR